MNQSQLFIKTKKNVFATAKARKTIDASHFNVYDMQTVMIYNFHKNYVF